jgi:FkbM family methyltransferase
LGSTVEDMRARLARFIGARIGDFRGKDRILRAIYPPGRIAGRPFAVDYFGKAYHGHSGEFVDWSVYVYGGAERAAIDAMRRLVAAHPRPWTLFDIGANSGSLCLPFTDLVVNGYAFEPVSITRARLIANLAANATRKIQVESCALGASEGDARIHYPSSFANHGVASLSADYHTGNEDSETVRVRTLDSYLAALSAAGPLLIKIDVEGSEMDVLRGASRLKDFDVLMLIETVNPGVLDLLRQWGFSGVSIHNDYSTLRRHPLDTRFDNHILSNFIAVQ